MNDQTWKSIFEKKKVNKLTSAKKKKNDTGQTISQKVL